MCRSCPSLLSPCARTREGCHHPSPRENVLRLLGVVLLDLACISHAVQERSSNPSCVLPINLFVEELACVEGVEGHPGVELTICRVLSHLAVGTVCCLALLLRMCGLLALRLVLPPSLLLLLIVLLLLSFFIDVCPQKSARSWKMIVASSSSCGCCSSSSALSSKSKAKNLVTPPAAESVTAIG